MMCSIEAYSFDWWALNAALPFFACLAVSLGIGMAIIAMSRS